LDINARDLSVARLSVCRPIERADRDRDGSFYRGVQALVAAGLPTAAQRLVVRRSIRKAFRSRYWIGAALQLGFVSMTGTTLPRLEYVPPAVLRHLG
jgi:hypothetical protein